MAVQYRLSSSKNVSARSFGDEVIAANFTRGVYYSLLGPAAQIWEGLIAGLPRDRVIAEVAALSEEDAGAFGAAAMSLVEALIEENLIEPADGIQPSAWTPVPAAAGAYGFPMLERFTDMEDLLLLDPVHDVEEMGWPHTNPPAQAG